MHGGVIVNIDAYNQREKMLHLREELLSVEEARLAGRVGCSIDELDSYLDNIIEEGRPRHFQLTKDCLFPLVFR